jgi:hypothetical protein
MTQKCAGPRVGGQAQGGYDCGANDAEDRIRRLVMRRL